MMVNVMGLLSRFLAMQNDNEKWKSVIRIKSYGNYLRYQ
jgi:hypothetical protein